MGNFDVQIDEKKLWEAVNDADGTRRVIGDSISKITSAANSMSAGFRTGYFYDKKKKKRVGGTKPVFSGDVEKHGRSIVGIVHPKNYAAMKCNHQHNTLLKSLKRG